MKTLFFSVKGAGHVNPTLPLVRALIERGHDVTYFLTPEWEERLGAIGAHYRNTGEGPFTTADYNPGKPFPLQLLPTAAAVLPRLVEQARALAPDVVVYDSAAVWGRAVAQVLDRPAICSVSTLVLGEREIGALLPPGGLNDERSEKAVVELGERWKVDVSVSEIGRFYSADNLVYSSEALNPSARELPGTFHFVGPLIRDTDSAAELSKAALSADRGGRRRVYVSMGTVAGEALGLDVAFFRPFIEAFGGDPGYELVVSVGKTLAPEAFGELPSNVVLRSSVPQVALLEHTDLFVTHAGANSVHEALFHGVPLVCVPCFAEQPLNAQRVTEVSAGVVLPRNELTPARIRAEVERVLGEPRFAAAAKHIRASLRATGGIELAMNVVTSAASRGRYAS